MGREDGGDMGREDGQWRGDMGHEEGTWKGDIERGYNEGGIFALNIVMHSSISCSALSMLALYHFPTTSSGSCHVPPGTLGNGV